MKRYCLSIETVFDSEIILYFDSIKNAYMLFAQLVGNKVVDTLYLQDTILSYMVIASYDCVTN